MTLPKWAFGDPAKIVEQAENRTCKGCIYVYKIWDTPACSLDKMSVKGMARRCKSYKDKGETDATRQA